MHPQVPFTSVLITVIGNVKFLSILRAFLSQYNTELNDLLWSDKKKKNAHDSRQNKADPREVQFWLRIYHLKIDKNTSHQHHLSFCVPFLPNGSKTGTSAQIEEVCVFYVTYLVIPWSLNYVHCTTTYKL